MIRGMLSRKHFLPLAAAFCLVAEPSFVTAQTPAKQRGFGKAKPGVPLLTRAELRACFDLQDRIRLGNESAMREREVLDKEKAEIVQQGTVLKEQLAVLDRTSQEAVDKYNAEAVERDKRIDAFEARMAPFNQKVEALAADREAWVKRCDNRLYDEIDEIQIKRGK
jgi:hypothetical protein